MRPAFRRALIFLGLPLALAVADGYWPESGSSALAVSADAPTVETAEFRLARLRQIAATVWGKEEVLKKVAAELATREAGLLRADTGPQAQAQVIQIIRRLASEEAPPIEIRSTELAALAPLGDDAYGAANVTVQIECSIAQLVNFLAAIAAQPELIATQDLQITAANNKEKTIRVRLTVSGVVPRQLLPDRAGKDKQKSGKAGGSQ
jgi:hypothetical protein